MAKRIQLRRGTTAQHSSFTGVLGELTVDTDKKALVLHDGATAGGLVLPNLVDGVIQETQLPTASTTVKGATTLATPSDVTNLSTSVAVTPKNVSDMLVGVGALAKGYRALFSAKLTEMVGTNTSSGTTITATITAHGLSVGDVILVNYRYLFFNSTQQASNVVTITSVPNANTFVFTSPMPASGNSTGGTCTVSYAIRNKYNIDSLTLNSTGRFTLAINTASGLSGTGFIPLMVATTADNTVVHTQPEAVTSATSLTVCTFNASGTAITPQWLYVGVTQ